MSLLLHIIFLLFILAYIDLYKSAFEKQKAKKEFWKEKAYNAFNKVDKLMLNKTKKVSTNMNKGQPSPYFQP